MRESGVYLTNSVVEEQSCSYVVLPGEGIGMGMDSAAAPPMCLFFGEKGASCGNRPTRNGESWRRQFSPSK